MMGSVIYSATDNEGKKRYGFCEASNNKEVLEILKTKSFQDIKLYGDAFLAFDKVDEVEKSPSDEEKLAKYELDMTLNPNFKTFFWFMLKNKVWLGLLLFGLFIALYGIYSQTTWVMIVGSLIMLSVPIWLWLVYQILNNFIKLYKAYLHGNWEEAEFWLNEFHHYDQKIFPQSFKIQLDLIGAKLLAIHYNPNEALEKVEQKYGFLKTIASIEYELLLSSIHAMNGNYSDCLNQTQVVHDKHKEIALISLDLAIKEVFVGSKEKASTLLNTIHIEELDEFSMPMVYAVHAIIVQEDDTIKALDYFEQYLEKMESISTNINVFELFSIVMGYYAISLHENKQTQEATVTLNGVWNILSIHGHKSLLEEIYKRMPEYKERSK